MHTMTSFRNIVSFENYSPSSGEMEILLLIDSVLSEWLEGNIGGSYLKKA